MRPNQQNRRMRGRGNRKGPNPLTRNYESNGPDVKIRGSAQQVADKYAALARDAQASGDRVMAENYLQHAEHYNRIIAAAQSQMQAQKESREEQLDDSDDREQIASAQPGEGKKADGSGPQPVINGTPAEVALEEQAVPETGRGKPDGAGEQKPSRRPRRPRKEGKPVESKEGSEDGSGDKAENRDAKGDGDARLATTAGN